MLFVVNGAKYKGCHCQTPLFYDLKLRGWMTSLQLTFSPPIQQSIPLLMVPMVLILDGNSEHVAQECWISIFSETKKPICDLFTRAKEYKDIIIELQNLLP